MKSIPLPWTTVFAPNDAGPHISSTAYFIPATGWVRCADIVEMRAAMEIAASTSGTLNIQVGYQVCNNEDAPLTAYAADQGGWETSPDVYYPAAWSDVSANTGEHELVRFGFLAKDTNDTLGIARVAGRVDIKTCT